jgi:predicted DNA-binding transcriptional regulator AlpA
MSDDENQTPHIPGKRMLSFPELKSVKGIPFTMQWVCRLVRDGLFPAPLKLGAGPTGTNLWIEAEIDAWIETKSAERKKAVV